MPELDLTIPEFTSPLIGPGDPPPFEVLNPDGASSVLLICDHASPTIPASLNDLGLDGEALGRHVAFDIGAADVTRLLSRRLDAPAVLAGYSRLLIDMNRQPGDPETILEVSDGTPVPGNRGLSEDDEAGRAEAFFWPYHRAITSVMAHLWRRGPAPALFSVHSFTPSLDGEDRQWDVGVLWNRDPRLALPLIEKLRRRDHLRVGDNQPYSGREKAYTIDLHAGAAGLPNCAVEIRQDHLETAPGAAHWAEIMGDALEEILTMETVHWVEHF
ncbi:MAG: N-formylglutamate amidohydrolase [Rhodospirillales bacterium]|jgi:predicted N-formylglutamate amidohydrolase|nr:N-formylglutamate amidohydrolase [Rhodospirillales bacterium]